MIRQLLLELLQSQSFVLALAILYSTGKAMWHVLEGQDWAKVPLVPGLQLTDIRHIGSGIQWPIVFWAVWAVAGFDWLTWATMLVLWALPWLVLKYLTGKLQRWDILWPVVIYRWARNRRR